MHAFLRWALPLALCSLGSLATAADRLVLTGSSTVAPLAAELGKRFEQQQGIRVDVQTGGSSRGVLDARRGLADIGMVSRALKPEEADLTGTVIAHDGIALIVHARNPVSALSTAQIVAIYTGAVRNWRAVGGPEAPITVIHKAQGRSTLELFLDHFRLQAPQVRASVVIGDNEQGLKTLAGNPHAIAYVSIGSAEAALALGQPIRLLPLEGVAARSAEVASGRYPLARPLLLVTHGEPEALARRFLDFAQSPANHDLVREFHFVPPLRRQAP